MIDLRSCLLAAAVSALSAFSAAAASPDLIGILSQRCIAPFLAGAKPVHTGLTELTGARASDMLDGWGKGQAFVLDDGSTGNPAVLLPSGRRQPFCVVIHRGLQRHSFGQAFDRFAQQQAVTEAKVENGWDGETETRPFTVEQGGRKLHLVAVNYPSLKSTSVYLMTVETFAARGLN